MDINYQERLAAYDVNTYPELAQTMLDAKEAYDAAKAHASELYNHYQFIQRQVIPARMDRDQIHNITVILRDGTKKQMIVIDQVSVKTPPENKLALWEWLRQHEAAEIITETVNSSTLAAYVRAQMKGGEPYPNDLCEVSMYSAASLRKA